MNNALLKAIGVGVGVLVVMFAIMWGIAKYSGMPIFDFPSRATTVQSTPSPTTPAFLR